MIAMCTATLLPDPMNAGDADVRAAGEAALASGCTEVSAWAHHLPALEGLGLDIAAVEAAMGWANGDSRAVTAEAEHLVGLVEAHGARAVVAVCLDPSIDDLGRARENLATLVDAVAAAGAQVCVEFLPWSGIPDLATAWALTEPLGPSAGLLLDTWHWVRQPGGPTPELLATIPGERIGYVQLCDASPEPTGDLMTEAMTARLLPGEGAVDFHAFWAAVSQTGATPLVAAEIFNSRLIDECGPLEAATAMKKAAESVLPTP